MARLKYILISVVATLIAVTAVAAEPSVQQYSSQDVTLLKFNDFMVNHITSALKLTGADRDRFSEIYISLIDANKSARGRNGQIKLDVEDLPNYTDEETEAIVMSTYKLSIDLIEIKREYYTHFREILTPREIVMMYDIERRGREIFAAELKRRKAARER